MRQIPFVISDVFGETRYSGNQLATFFSAESLSDTEMQQIAREIHFSETTFILRDTPRAGGYDVRIFTPGSEVDFAGHPTLGTAWLIRERILQGKAKRILLNLKVGQVPVDFEDRGPQVGILWMRQTEPVFGKILDASEVLQVLGLGIQDLDEGFPVQEVSTGLHHIIVPLVSMEALKKIRLDRDAYFHLIGKTWGRVVLAFASGGYAPDQKLAVRVFPVCYGIDEDPATGSGNGCLAAYLVKNRYFKTDRVDVVVGQGYEIGRPSTLYLEAAMVKNRIDVRVGGRVIPIAEGFWR